MATIVYIKDIESSHLLCLGIDEAGECRRYTVTPRAYAELGSPPRGALIDDAQLLDIKYSDEYVRAKKKALALLALADNNEKTLLRKLRAYGIGYEIASDVVREMVGLGYIDECRQLERLILHEANISYRGPSKIMAKLTSRGYSPTDVRRVMGELSESGELDFARSARALIEKKLPLGASAEERRALLMKNGYKINTESLC